jgi:hypothetical protein
MVAQCSVGRNIGTPRQRLLPSQVRVCVQVRGQTHLLESLDTGMSAVSHRVASVTGRVEGVLARMPRRLYYLVCFLVPFLLALLLILLLKAV